MKLTLTIVVAMLLLPGLALADQGDQCNADYVYSNIGGSWKVNNTFGQGFGGFFWNKSKVNIRKQKKSIWVDNNGPFGLTNFRYEADLEGLGIGWCTFTATRDKGEKDEDGRIKQDDNQLWIVEFGNHHQGKNKVELSRR